MCLDVYAQRNMSIDREREKKREREREREKERERERETFEKGLPAHLGAAVQNLTNIFTFSKVSTLVCSLYKVRELAVQHRLLVTVCFFFFYYTESLMKGVLLGIASPAPLTCPSTFIFH